MEILRESRINIKRDIILDAATMAFRDEGYETTSMDRIAELAGASKRTVYNHFGSKEALFQAVVERLFEHVASLKQVEWDPNRPLEHQLTDFARAKTLVADDDSTLCLMKCVLGVFIRQPELVREAIARAADDENKLVDWLKKADAAGHMKVDDPELAATLFWSLAEGALFWPQLLEGRMEPETRDRLTKEVVAMFLARYRSASG
jgi:TetR/AcrR family transcriptional regulator of autoinduction and epiphytic fitness